MGVYSRYLLALFERYYCVLSDQDRRALAETIDFLQQKGL